jgi:hypothetical protein
VVPDVYLITGFPGVGKYTVALALVQQLAARGQDARLVDNHYVTNPVFGVIATDGETTLPPGVWELVAQVREAVLTAISSFGPADASYVFTNYVREAESAKATPYAERLRALAEDRGGRFVHVALTCERDEQVRRVARPERADRLKSPSSTWLRELFETDAPWQPPGAWVLDVTTLPPEVAADWILQR